MPILNYTTSIDCYKTISEIQRLLSNAGAQKIIIDNDEKKLPVGITFSIIWNEQPVAFVLPCNYNGVFNAMCRNKKIPNKLKTTEQALRVSWRIVKDWIEAQMAIVEAEIVTLPEVFLPYAVTKSGDTVYKHIDKNKKLLLN